MLISHKVLYPRIKQHVLFVFAYCIFAGCSTTPSITIKEDCLSNIKRVAILDFTDAPGSDAGYSGRVISGALSRQVLGIQNWKLIERERISEVIKELEFQQTDYIDDATAVRLGKLLGADGVIGGSVSQYRIGSIPFLFFIALDKDVYKVGFNFRLIDVRSGEVCLSAGASSSSFVSLEDAASKASKKAFDIILTKVQPRLPSS